MTAKMVTDQIKLSEERMWEEMSKGFQTTREEMVTKSEISEIMKEELTKQLANTVINFVSRSRCAAQDAASC